jgi:ribonuclease VapC
MLIDSSALLAILLGETDAEQIGRAIDNDPTRFISGVSVVETSIVVETRYGPIGGRELDLLLHNAAIETVPLTLEQVDWARYAARVYGKGRHPARLNFGDCFSYALARVSGEPLLFKGNDFIETGIPAVLR